MPVFLKPNIVLKKLMEQEVNKGVRTSSFQLRSESAATSAFLAFTCCHSNCLRECVMGAFLIGVCADQRRFFATREAGCSNGGLCPFCHFCSAEAALQDRKQAGGATT